MLPNDRRVEGFTFSENGTTSTKLPKGLLERGLLITGAGILTISGAGSAVRTRGTPIRRIALHADNGVVLHSVVPSDLIREAELYEQTALSALVSPPPAATVAAHAFSFAIPLMFVEPFAAMGNVTALPTWVYQELTLVIDWGSHAQLVVGGAGAITTMAVALTALGAESDFSGMGDARVWGRDMGRSMRSYVQVAAPGAASQEFAIEIARTADIRSLIIVTEDANGVPTDGILNDVTLQIDNIRRQFSRVPIAAIKVNNSKVFGIAPPVGTYVLEFADDRDIANVLEATRMSDLRLILNTTAVAGTIRVFQKRLAPGISAAA